MTSRRNVMVKGGGNQGKESSKVKWECTICVSCRRRIPDCIVPQQRESGVDWREFRSRRVHALAALESCWPLPYNDLEPDFTFCPFASDGHIPADKVDRGGGRILEAALYAAANDPLRALHLRRAPAPGRQAEASDPQLRIPNPRPPKTPHRTCLGLFQQPRGRTPSRAIPRPTGRLASAVFRFGTRPQSLIGFMSSPRSTGPTSESPASPSAPEANPCRADLPAVGQGRAVRSTSTTYHRARKLRTGNLARRATTSSRREHRSPTGGPPSMSAKAISGIAPEITPTTPASTVTVPPTSIGMSETSPPSTTGLPRKRISLTRRTRPARGQVAVENWSRRNRPTPTVRVGILCRSLE